jgi:hypothetical protein
VLAVEPGYVDHITQQGRFLDCLECAEQLLHQTLSGLAGRFDVSACQIACELFEAVQDCASMMCTCRPQSPSLRRSLHSSAVM